MNRNNTQFRAMVESVVMLKEEKVALDRTIKIQEQELIKELINNDMGDCLTINWTRLKRMQ